MELLHHIQRMARYNQWANAVILDAAATLSETDLKSHASQPFRSIHGTITHILLAQKLWLSRANPEYKCDDIGHFWANGQYAKPEDESSQWEKYETDPAKLGAMLRASDQAIIDFVCSSKLPANPTSAMTYKTTDGAEKSSPYDVSLLHLFNHSTHHRGQITVGLIGRGIPPPEMDMIYWYRSHDQSKQ
ncbi:hypothetical protein CAOG_06365 [Capsaspora owczarzaki ATCC 30864]|uniref:Damage-inducible protein DinB n=1 Tax=Capsaspora owczarzaki (strain ATCC 30864) TaxID=595528 RepID=A0A0D2VWN0_CAPO3|nr:hypothetical protein CAOG_06365 [Capsaspora owczarzaki ATCC 30864]KJE95987.1 hypothetical protein CAOG_006365 [Capsaspora owczarzaki ATCC 30864]|eukprot:XP_004345114.1 hypothetical protein CAOG_06365 [Capsaspora owczarzaki ATCC 30864]